MINIQVMALLTSVDFLFVWCAQLQHHTHNMNDQYTDTLDLHQLRLMVAYTLYYQGYNLH